MKANILFNVYVFNNCSSSVGLSALRDFTRRCLVAVYCIFKTMQLYHFMSQATIDLVSTNEAGIFRQSLKIIGLNRQV